MKSTSVVILAAGMSSRMKSTTPKILHKIAAKPIINYVIDTAIGINPAQIITVVGKNSQTIIDLVTNYYPNMQICVQHNQQGTADAVKSATINQATENVIILYGDTPLISSSTINLMLAKLDKSPLVMLGFRTGSPAEYGRFITEGTTLKAIVEYKEATNEQLNINLCNAGIMAVKTKILTQFIGDIKNNNSKGEYYLTDLVELVTKNNLHASFIEVFEQEVLGINTKEELSQCEAIMQNKLRAFHLQNGVTLIDPASVIFSEDTIIEADSVIHPFVVFGPKVKIDSNVEIKSFSHLENCHIMQHAIIGPYARIRPGTVIEENVHIGNFVEIKNSEIKSGAKINHLSYVGDAIIGAKTNIGAGTITCNYDGFSKHKTIIGENVFIGSNTSLIAPINIGDGSMIAAGSTISKDIPSDALAIERSEQQIKENLAAIMRKKKQK